MIDLLTQPHSSAYMHESQTLIWSVLWAVHARSVYCNASIYRSMATYVHIVLSLSSCMRDECLLGPQHPDWFIVWYILCPDFLLLNDQGPCITKSLCTTLSYYVLSIVYNLYMASEVKSLLLHRGEYIIVWLLPKYFYYTFICLDVICIINCLPSFSLYCKPQQILHLPLQYLLQMCVLLT